MFLEGDPDQPIINGSVHNAEQMPPFDLPAQRHISGIRSQTIQPDNENGGSSDADSLTGEESSGESANVSFLATTDSSSDSSTSYSGVYFDDSDDGKTVRVRSEKRLYLESKQNIVQAVANAHTRYIGTNYVTVVGGYRWPIPYVPTPSFALYEPIDDNTWSSVQVPAHRSMALDFTYGDHFRSIDGYCLDMSGQRHTVVSGSAVLRILSKIPGLSTVAGLFGAQLAHVYYCSHDHVNHTVGATHHRYKGGVRETSGLSSPLLKVVDGLWKVYDFVLFASHYASGIFPTEAEEINTVALHLLRGIGNLLASLDKIASQTLHAEAITETATAFGKAADASVTLPDVVLGADCADAVELSAANIVKILAGIEDGDSFHYTGGSYYVNAKKLLSLRGLGGTLIDADTGVVAVRGFAMQGVFSEMDSPLSTSLTVGGTTTPFVVKTPTAGMIEISEEKGLTIQAPMVTIKDATGAASIRLSPLGVSINGTKISAEALSQLALFSPQIQDSV